ncbi:FHA domain-containing protein [Cellulosimicrobium sp. SH8]|uniref:FHA domain-containing protein n=1 Tax=Cellulosimicrobium sp. SH8 TaxID=2952936 RepID=UPI0021F392E4|nr:FHA domain-containing protein [Cellulosimicrobium sp. SH8]
MTLRYVTGTARAIVRGGTVVVLPGPVEASLVEQVWDQLGTDAGVVEVLQVLTGAFGSSLRTVPPFVVAVVADRRVHVAARGRVTVTLELDGGERVRVEGEGVTTWSERVLDDVVELLVRADTGVVGTLDEAPAGEPLLGGATSLPLVSGVVLAGAVAWPLAERPAPPVVEDLPVDDGPAADPAPADRTSWGTTVGSAPDEVAPAVVTAAPLGATLRLPEETIAPEPESAAPVLPVLADLPATAELEAAASPAEDADDDYAHLWGSTILRTVEDAAVRTEDDEEHDEPASPSPVTPPVPPAPDAGEPPLPPPAATGDGLIAGVPREWTGATPAAAHRAATVADPDDEPTEAEGEPSPGFDHDGHTVHSSAIADLRAAAQDAGGGATPVPPPPSFSAPPGPGQQQILARTCAQGHANPPSRDTCAVCGGPLEGDAELAIRPPLGRVLVSTGQAVELDRPVVVGRRPRTPRSQAADLPRLVTVPSPQQDISRSHLEITLEGWHVLVSDMATTNGTTLLRAGQPPRRLHPSEPVLVVDGDVADLGDGVTLVFEGIR